MTARPDEAAGRSSNFAPNGSLNSTTMFTSCCSMLESAKSSTKMSFTITRNLEQIPSYPVLCNLAEQNHACLTGNERTGSFSFRGLEGDYEFGEDNIHGTFAGHGVKGEFSFEIGKAAVTITDKPFWLPEMLLKQKITEGLETLCSELA